MNKRDYFIKALRADACKKREWVNQLFALVVSDTKSGQHDDYPYRLKRVPEATTWYFINPEEENRLTPIEDAPIDVVILTFDEPMILNAFEITNYGEGKALKTTYGRVFVNYLCLVIPFGGAIPFVNGFFDIRAVEDKINVMLINDPEDPTVKLPPDGKIFVRQYLQFCEYALSLVAYNSLCVTSVSRKSLVSHPDARKVRDQLVEQYKDQLSDPAIVARIGQQLEALDREWLAGDPTMNYYTVKDKKLFGAVRKKMYYMFGGESPFQDGTTVEFIPKSLEEGIDTDHFPAMINSLRFGSFNRGAQTQLGGESTKTIYRMLGTVRIAEPDCGTKIGIPVEITAKNQKQFLGFNVVENGKSILLTNDNIESYINTFPQVRGPLTCKTAGRNVCAVCVGEALAEQPDGLAAAAAGLGGRFLSLFLAKAHSGTLVTQKWDRNKRIT